MAPLPVSGPAMAERGPRATQEATPSSQSGESCALDLPSSSDIRDYALQRPSQEAGSATPSSGASLSFPHSSDVEPDSGNLNTEQKESRATENSQNWLDFAMSDPAETTEEDDGLRKSLDRFYEDFGGVRPASGNPLSAAVHECLSQKITDLRGQESQEYPLRCLQMARVIFRRDGCSALQRHSRDARFCPRGEGSASLDDEEPTPGLSKDVIRFLLQQNVMKDA